MYKSIYVCDCCGKEMQSPMYTLELKTNSFCIQDRTSWHYCSDCWGYVKKDLTKKNEVSDLEKTVEELKKENDILKKDAAWSQKFWEAIFKAAAKQEKKDATYIPPYMSCTVSTTSDEEKITQGKPIINDRFSTTVECCCDSVYKDDLDYKWSVGMI